MTTIQFDDDDDGFLVYFTYGEVMKLYNMLGYMEIEELSKDNSNSNNKTIISLRDRIRWAVFDRFYHKFLEDQNKKIIADKQKQKEQEKERAK